MKSLSANCAEKLDFTAVSPKQIRQRSSSLVFETAATLALAMDILGEVMKFRRSVGSDHACKGAVCQTCYAPHLQKVISAIVQKKPVTFILPAFPGKSPNHAKVLGALPDMAERKALEFLDHLASRIKELYAPGAHLILCSDGRVFSDVIGMREEDVTDYQDALDQMIADLGRANISTFNLDELAEGQEFDDVRAELMSKYGQSLEMLRDKVRMGGAGSSNAEHLEAHRMYCGITRFLFEDALHPNQTKSRTAIQKDARSRAYEVIRRSNAWSELLAERFPEAVRLSIHPQACGAAKIGVQLLGIESWMTPWHGVAVETNDGFVLMKRWEAEKLAAELVYDTSGRASHYRLTSSQDLGVEENVHELFS